MKPWLDIPWVNHRMYWLRTDSVPPLVNNWEPWHAKPPGQQGRQKLHLASALIWGRGTEVPTALAFMSMKMQMQRRYEADWASPVISHQVEKCSLWGNGLCCLYFYFFFSVEDSRFLGDQRSAGWVWVLRSSVTRGCRNEGKTPLFRLKSRLRYECIKYTKYIIKQPGCQDCLSILT